jgi:DNA-binding CsgD family transcriptional regulator
VPEAVPDRKPDAAFGRRLSPREAQVLEMTSLGLTNREMAARLSVTPHAVKFHLSSIYRKLGVTNRTEAAVVYLRQRAAALG